MISGRGAFCIFLFALAPIHAANAASVKHEIVDELKGKTVLLRGMEAGDTLSFDAQGAEVGTYPTGPFAIAPSR